jgi:hypothetical protein
MSVNGPAVVWRFRISPLVPSTVAMSAPLQTTVSVMQRTITVRCAEGVDERYALFRFNRGEVYWRLDKFRGLDDLGQPRWVEYVGRLSVGQVIGRLPDQARTIDDWTRKEIALGTVVADDIFSAMIREEALAQLQAELDAFVGVRPGTA